MSLILEALRKSEAERQIGRAPGLLTPMAMATAQHSDRRWWLAGSLAVLLVIAIALAWWLGRNGQSAANGANQSAIASEPTPAAGTPPLDPPAAVVAATTQEQTATAPDAVDPASPPATRPLPAAGPSDFPSDPDFESTERESLPLPAPASAPAATVVEPVDPAVPAEVPVSAALPATPPAAEGPAATPFRTLTESERAGLPPLRLSMHVFNAEPSRRFVMIDGRRRAEGDTLAAEVKLAEIRREGAIVDIRGRLVLIERP